MINWENIIETLNGGSVVTVDPTRWDTNNIEYKKILDIWIKANFNLNSIKWTNFYPDIDFPMDVIDKQLHYINIKNVHRAWISKIDPGYMAPWHWDIDDHEQEYLKKGPITRYTIIIRPMVTGQLLIIGNDHYYLKPKDTIIKWTNHREWHSSVNNGLEPSYLLHILGY